ncbi:hypothetical protein BN1013_01841 [Candidatus Rubidus massiliensis]|nr:hypothetical protein BN1013_01841 [Candidatus Rubidus massiliensis]
MLKIRFTNEVEDQFLRLQKSKNKKVQFKAVGKALAYMNANLRHPSLNTHKFDEMKSPFGGDVFESDAQNKTSGAYRIFWVYGPNKFEITILAITPHP